MTSCHQGALGKQGEKSTSPPAFYDNFVINGVLVFPPHPLEAKKKSTNYKSNAQSLSRKNNTRLQYYAHR